MNREDSSLATLEPGKENPTPTVFATFSAAIPDAVTAFGFVYVWAKPLTFGPLLVKTAMLTMLLEFFLIHATGFYTAFDNFPTAQRRQRFLILFALSTFYLLMIGGISMFFGEWWPLLAFGWLAASKIFWVRNHSQSNSDEAFMQMAAWARSVVAYLGSCILTLLAPIPRWGMTETLQAKLGLNGDGVWVDEPHRVVAFGVLYFGVISASKAIAAVRDRRRFPLTAS